MRIMIGTLLMFGAGSASGQAPANEAQLRAYISCAAYALRRTGEYPETIDVYQMNKPVTAAVAARARTGMLWTNRAFFARSVAAIEWQKQRGSVPTGGALNVEMAEWLKRLNDAEPLQREAIGSNCRPVFERADRYCAEGACVAKP